MPPQDGHRRKGRGSGGLLSCLCSQLVYLMAMALCPVLYLSALGMYAESALAGFFAAPLWLHLMALGLLIAAESYFYLKLPVDLIPDFIPIIGRCDDCLAAVFMAFGVVVAIFGGLLYSMSSGMPPLRQADSWEDGWH